MEKFSAEVNAKMVQKMDRTANVAMTELWWSQINQANISGQEALQFLNIIKTVSSRVSAHIVDMKPDVQYAFTVNTASYFHARGQRCNLDASIRMKGDEIFQGRRESRRDNQNQIKQQKFR